MPGRIPLQELHRRAAEGVGVAMRAVGDDAWARSTPCTEWDVQALVRHIVSGNLWVPALVEGETIAEVGDRFDGDILGADALAAWAASAEGASAAFELDGAMERTVHLSFGDFPGAEYAWQRFVDSLIHSWDLARAVGADETLDPELVDACYARMLTEAELWRAGGALGPAVEVPEDAGPQAKLLGLFGRNP